MVELTGRLIVRLAEKWRGGLFDLENFAKLNSISMDDVVDRMPTSSRSIRAYAQSLVSALQSNETVFGTYVEDHLWVDRDEELIGELNECLQPQGYTIAIT